MKTTEDEIIVTEMTRMLELLDENKEDGLKCSSCGSFLDPEDLFCATCGQKLRKFEKPKVIVRKITIV